MNETEQGQKEKPTVAADNQKPVTPKTGRLASLRNDPNGWMIMVLALGSAAAAFGAAAGSGFGLWGWKAGMAALPWTALMALVALLWAIAVIVMNRRKERKTRWAFLGIGGLVSVGFLGYLMGFVTDYLGHPAIHDVTTDLADPPEFTALKLRADNWDNIPGADDGDMRGMNPRQRWATVHQDAYPDVRSVRINQPVAEVIAKAKRLAEDRGWKVAGIDPVAGRLEATDTVSLFRFKDDIVLRAQPAENGAASIIDMRSVSRVGVSDLGVNAARVRQFLSDLSGTTTAASQ